MTDDTLNRLTAAVDNLTQALDKLAELLPAQSADLELEPAAQRRGPGRPRKTGVEGNTMTGANPVPAGIKLAEAAALDYETVKAATLEAASKKGHGRVFALLQKYGVESAKGLKPEQWAPFMKEVAAL